MLCRKCNSELDIQSNLLPDGTLRCPYCGATYRRSIPAQPQPNPLRPIPQQPIRQETITPEPVFPQNPQYNTYDPSTSSTAKSPQATATQIAHDIGSIATGLGEMATRKAKRTPKLVVGLLFIIVILLVAIVLSKTSNPYSEQYDLIKRYETAYNKRDYGALTGCCEPSLNDFNEGLTSIIGSFAGLSNMSDYQKMVPFISEMLGASGYLDALGQVKLTPYKCIIDSAYADGSYSVIAVHAKISVDGTEADFDLAYSLKKVDKKWYFANIQGTQEEKFTKLGLPVPDNASQFDFFIPAGGNQNVTQGGW